MKNTLLFIGLGVSAFAVWQWWLSRADGKMVDADEFWRQTDMIGRRIENLQNSNRPALIDSEHCDRINGVFLQLEGLWTKVFGGCSSKAKNPLIFGSEHYGN